MDLESKLAGYQQLIERSLCLWPKTSGATARLLNVSENIMYQIDGHDGLRAVIRLHRQNNHSKNRIQSELDWINALQLDGVIRTPDILRGRDGKQIQSVLCDVDDTADARTLRHLVMFEFIDGREAQDSDDALSLFTTLGQYAARLHNHSERWRVPAGFERAAWNTHSLLGEQPVWGRWQDAPGVNRQALLMLNSLGNTVQARLQKLGCDKSVYGLIHADMRYTNLMVTDGGIRLIDFDDCGSGWHLYDFATAVSFIEDHPQLDDYKQAWLSGYRTCRALAAEVEREIDTLIMLRRLALLAWMGTHPEVAIVQQLQGHYADVTLELTEAYLLQCH